MTTELTTPALVLRRWPAGESALLVRFLTPEEGIVAARVGGAQKPTGSLHFLGNPFTLAEIQLVQGRGMAKVTQARCLATFHTLLASLPRMQAASLILEAAESASTEGLSNATLFLLTLDTLRAIDQWPLDLLDRALLAFTWQTLDGLGAAPLLTSCIRTGGTEAGEFVVPLVNEGGFACAEAAWSFPPHARVPVAVLHLMHALAADSTTSEELPELEAWSGDLVRVALAVLLHFLQAALGQPLQTAAPWLAASPKLALERPPGELTEP